MQTLVLTLGVLAIVGAVAWHAVDTLWSRRLVARRTVLVQLRSGAAMQGTLWSRHGRTVVLKGATLLEPGADKVAMDGAVVLDRDTVDWIQIAG